MCSSDLHHCLGASLARLEAAIAFEHLIGRFPGLALDGDVVWNGRINLRGPAHLPVSVDQGAGDGAGQNYGARQFI